MIAVFIILLSAHSLGDFALQNKWMVRRKEKNCMLLLHAGIHMVVSYLLLQQWAGWQLPLLAGASHLGIDALKRRLPATPWTFAVDQAAHVTLLWGAAFVAFDLGWNSDFNGVGWDVIVVAGGGSAVILGSGYFVGEVADALMRRNEGLKEKLSQGLEEGGKSIGQLERAMILLLILIGQPGGIGFLVAAKSVLRFKEAEDQALAEYILIGTLWSFSLAIGISSLVSIALELR